MILVHFGGCLLVQSLAQGNVPLSLIITIVNMIQSRRVSVDVIVEERLKSSSKRVTSWECQWSTRCLDF
jgi:hypothetical protein